MQPYSEKSLTFPNVYYAYSKHLDSLGINATSFEIEVMVEKLKDWSEYGTVEDVHKWILKCQTDTEMEVEEIPLDECLDWFVDTERKVIRHKSKDFFEVVGVRTKSSHSREIQIGWDQPFIKQIGLDGGILGLLRTKRNQVPYYLVEAKAEPGNPQIVLISPTLQATFANLRKSHGGIEPNFSKKFWLDKDEDNFIFKQWIPEDGGRLYKKRNLAILKEEELGFNISLKQNFRWVTLFQLRYFIQNTEHVNPHIRSILSFL